MRIALFLLALNSCALVSAPDDGRLFRCERDGGCEAGAVCGPDNLCRRGGGAGGGAAGGGAAGGSAAGGGGGGLAPDAGQCGGRCDAGTICGGGGATPGVCSPPRVCRSGFCWESPLPQGDDVTDAVAFGPGDIWLVGHHGLVLHSEAGGWVLVESGTTEDLLDVYATGPTNIYAVGGRCTITHYDGARWSVEPTSTGCLQQLTTVWCDEAGTAYALGADGIALTRPSGVPWMRVSVVSGPSSGSFTALFSFPGGELYAAHEFGWLFKLVGGEFVRQQTSTPGWPLGEVVIQSALTLGDSTYLGGAFGTIERRQHDGGWSTYAGFRSGDSILKLFGSSEADIWAVTYDSVLYRYGLRHFPQPLVADGGVVYLGQQVAAGVVLDAGESLIAGWFGFLATASLDAGTRTLSLRNPSAGTVGGYAGLFGLDGPANLYAPSVYGNVGRRFAGAAWNDLSIPALGSMHLTGAWGLSPNDLWVTAAELQSDAGATGHYDGVSWKVAAVATPLHGLWGLSTGEVFFGGRGRIFVSRDAGAPTEDTRAVADTDPIRSLWGASDFAPTAVGDQGRVRTRPLPYDGGDWLTVQIGTGHHRSIHGATLGGGQYDVWVAGTGGALLHYEDGGFRPQLPGPTVRDLNAVFAEPDRTWVAGDRGTLLLRDASGWSVVPLPSGQDLRGVWAQPDGGGVWVVGGRGAVLSKIPGR